jgi:hypothetical protein
MRGVPAKKAAPKKESGAKQENSQEEIENSRGD